MDNNKEELFCQGIEIKSLAELLLRMESERMLPGYSLPLVEHDHLERYMLASEYAKDKSVLDIACGAGYGSNILATKGNAKSVIGADLDKEAIRYASHRFQDDRVKYFNANAENFKFDNLFDLIVSFETIEHVPDYKSFLESVVKSLNDTGTFLVSTPISRFEEEINPPNNTYHLREWGFEKFQEIVSDYLEIKKVYIQLYQNSFVNRQIWLDHEAQIRSWKQKVRSLIKKKILGEPNSPRYVDNWQAKSNFSKIEEFTGQYPLVDLGSVHIGYQILECRKKL